MTQNAAEQWPLRRGSLICPTPVAIAFALERLQSGTEVMLKSATRMPTDELTETAAFLVFHVLVAQDEANFRLAQHLREKLG